MNRYELDLLLARDMDEAVAEAEKNGVKKMKDKIKGCFLYKYLKAKKDIVAEQLLHSANPHDGKKFDKYIELKCAYLKICEDPGSQKANDEYIAVYRKKMGRDPGDDINKAQSEAEDELLAGIVSDHVGRYTRITVDADTRERIRDLKEIKETADNIDPLDMYSEFIRAKNLEPTLGNAPRVAECSEEHMKKCEELYYIMRRDKKQENAYMPLYCDQSNGAGVYLIGRERFGESAMIQIFKDKTGTDINILRRMIISQDTLDDTAAVKQILCTSGFSGDSVLKIIKKRTCAIKTAEKILGTQGYTAAKIRSLLKECSSDRSKILSILGSDSSQYHGDPKALIDDSVYDDEVLLEVLKHGFGSENAEIILQKRKISENAIRKTLEICYPCVVYFDMVQEQAEFDNVFEIQILAKIKVCFSVAAAFKYLSDNAELFDMWYSYENVGFPTGADERFRLKMEGEFNKNSQNP